MNRKWKVNMVNTGLDPVDITEKEREEAEYYMRMKELNPITYPMVTMQASNLPWMVKFIRQQLLEGNMEKVMEMLNKTEKQATVVYDNLVDLERKNR